MGAFPAARPRVITLCSPMNTYPRFKAPSLPGLDARPRLSHANTACMPTVIVYDDGDALVRATRRFGALDQIPLWRADLLPDPRAHGQAARDLESANVLVISLSESEEFSAIVDDWISMFLAAHQAEGFASVFILLGPDLVWYLSPEPAAPADHFAVTMRRPSMEAPAEPRVPVAACNGRRGRAATMRACPPLPLLPLPDRTSAVSFRRRPDPGNCGRVPRDRRRIPPCRARGPPAPPESAEWREQGRPSCSTAGRRSCS